MTKVKTKAGNEEDGFVEPFNVSYIPEKIGRWVIDIDDGISCPSQFQWAIRALDMADEENPVQINLQCNGGSLSATDSIIHAMRKCRGHIHIIATGGCHSSASLILLEADSFELSENFHALLHCGSLGNIGNLNEYTAQAAFDSKFMPRILRNSYQGFLSEGELEKLLDGKDIWLDAEGWMERTTNRNEHFKAKEAKVLKTSSKRRKKIKIPEEL